MIGYNNQQQSMGPNANSFSKQWQQPTPKPMQQPPQFTQQSPQAIQDPWTQQDQGMGLQSQPPQFGNNIGGYQQPQVTPTQGFGGTGGQFGGMYQNPQMSPYGRPQQQPQTEPWGVQGWQQEPRDPIADNVWGSMGLWNKGGW